MLVLNDAGKEQATLNNLISVLNLNKICNIHEFDISFVIRSRSLFLGIETLPVRVVALLSLRLLMAFLLYFTVGGCVSIAILILQAIIDDW